MCKCYLLAFALLLIVERSVLVISQVTLLPTYIAHVTLTLSYADEHGVDNCILQSVLSIQLKDFNETIVTCAPTAAR